MVFTMIKDDLFNHICSFNSSSYDNGHRVPVHCISGDFTMSGGIAVPMAEKFNLRRSLNMFCGVKPPDCIFTNNVMNLITKENVWDSPTYSSLKRSLELCRDICVERDIKYLVMPKIGCGIDGLDWSVVSVYVREVFKATDIDILVCHL